MPKDVSAYILLIVCLILSLFLTSLFFNIPLAVLLKDIPEGLFPHPRENGFYGNSSYAYTVLSLVIATFCCSVLFINKILARSVSVPQKSVYRTTFLENYKICHVVTVIMLAVTCLQTIQHARYFSNIYSTFSVLDDVQKKRYLMGFVYDYASLCRQYSRVGHHKGELITDMDVSNAREMTLHRRLAYYLYPIRIRANEGDEKPDYLIYFQKKGAAAIVPEDYAVKFRIDDSNIFAVRKDLL